MKRLTPSSCPLGISLFAFSALSIGLLTASAAHAAPVFSYQFPASWNGTGTTITDQSAAGHNAVTTGAPVLSSNVPPGAPAGAQSLNSVGGGSRTTNTALLTNATIAAAGGFRFDVSINWDGTDNTFHSGKIIDYAGTEYLQIQAVDAGAGTATLRFGVNDGPKMGATLVTPIVPHTWYHVIGTFNSQGNPVAGDGSLSGVAKLDVNGVTITENVTKTNAGDLLNRRIGVGNFSASSGKLIEFHGDIYNPSVSMIPEPAAGLLATSALLVGLFAARRRPS
jgi:hypothetical protein